MIELIKASFPEIDSCIHIKTEKHSFIFEDNNLNKGIFVTDLQPKHLHIENKSNNNFYFIQNDDCVMKNIRGGQCDYIIFNSSNFHFIDVKVAKGNFSDHSSTAYKQIENTFKYYSKKIDFSVDILLYGLVCFPNKRRIVKSSESTKKKEFKTKYRIDLKVGNYILFE